MSSSTSNYTFAAIDNMSRLELTCLLSQYSTPETAAQDSDTKVVLKCKVLVTLTRYQHGLEFNLLYLVKQGRLLEIMHLSDSQVCQALKRTRLPYLGLHLSKLLSLLILDAHQLGEVSYGNQQALATLDPRLKDVFAKWYNALG